jgi:hypothetical protein
MTKRISTKKISKSATKSRKRKPTSRPTNGSIVSEQSLREGFGFLARENGRLNESSMEIASPAVDRAVVPSTPHDALSAVIEREISEGMQRYRRIFIDGSSNAADRVVVREALNGTLYRHLASRRGLELQIVYFDTDPIAMEQFGRILRQLL